MNTLAQHTLDSRVTALEREIATLRQLVYNMKPNVERMTPIGPGYYPPGFVPAGPTTWPPFTPHEVTCKDGSTIRISSPIVAQAYRPVQPDKTTII
jgi:hypothetical protein